jgi:glycosyltransferase involved in cell wall biosynthesis
MKIGVDIRCLMEEKYSGISEYCYNMIDALTEHDKENQYILFYNKAKGEAPPLPQKANISYKSFNYPNKFFNLSLRFLKWPKVDELIGGIDVFIIPNFLFLNLSKNCKKILIVHDLSFDIFPEFFTFKKRLWHRLIGPRAWCHRADSIIAISENTKQDIVDLYGISSEKISVIYPGISAKYFDQVPANKLEEVKKKYNLPEKYFLHVGNVEPRKNIESSLKAFDLLEDKEIHFVIAGNLAWKYQKIRDLAEKLSSANRIHFLGYVDADDKASLYVLSQGLIYPSIYEGFGLPPVEAMACGAPVVAGANSSLLESVADAGILVDSYSINDIVKAMNVLLKDEITTKNLKAKGREFSQKFIWKKSVEEIYALISKLL